MSHKERKNTNMAKIHRYCIRENDNLAKNKTENKERDAKFRAKIKEN